MPVSLKPKKAAMKAKSLARQVVTRVNTQVVMRVHTHFACCLLSTTRKVQGCKADSLHLQPRSEHNMNITQEQADMRTLLIAAIGLALIIGLLYLSLAGLSSTLAKYDYCYDVVMAAKYDLSQPDFTAYGLKSEPECKP